MKLLKILLLNIFLTSSVHASTFVGNGGNAGDIELQVAINQIQQTLNLIVKNSADPELRLCTCYEKFKEQSVCTHLRRLNEQQTQYCARVIRHKAKDIASLLDDKGRVHFSWTSEEINVQEKTGLRAVDAVTDFKTKNITLNRNSFVRMNSTERVFLLAHEMFHLTELNDIPLSDDIEYPNFPGSQGGRQLINAMASSVVIESFDYGTFQEYGKPLLRSQAVKKMWLEGFLNNMGATTDNTNSYGADSLYGGGVQLRYQFNEWGLLLNYSNINKNHGILTTIEVKETRNLFGVGITYRWFPFAEPLSFLGQSHFVFNATIESFWGRVTIQDQFIEFKDTARSIGPRFGVSYYVPFSGDLWGFAGLNVSSHQIKYEKISLEYKPQSVVFDAGVSYAF